MYCSGRSVGRRIVKAGAGMAVAVGREGGIVVGPDSAVSDIEAGMHLKAGRSVLAVALPAFRCILRVLLFALRMQPSLARAILFRQAVAAST